MCARVHHKGHEGHKEGFTAVMGIYLVGRRGRKGKCVLRRQRSFCHKNARGADKLVSLRQRVLVAECVIDVRDNSSYVTVYI